MPTIRKHLNQQHTKNQRTPEETMVLGNNSRIEMNQLQQITMVHNAVPQPVDPIARRRLAGSSRNVAFHIKWLRETTEQKLIISSNAATAMNNNLFPNSNVLVYSFPFWDRIDFSTLIPLGENQSTQTSSFITASERWRNFIPRFLVGWNRSRRNSKLHYLQRV